MKTEVKTINFNEKEFKIKKENKYKIYYKCCHWNDIKCKAIAMFDKILNQYELITDHNARCKNLFDPIIEKNESAEFFQENNFKNYNKINNTVFFFKDSCQFTTKIFEQSVSHESISKNHTEQETNIKELEVKLIEIENEKKEMEIQLKNALQFKKEAEAREIRLKEEIEERERKFIEKNYLLKNNKEENSNTMSIEMSVINGEPSKFDTEDCNFFVSNNFDSKNDTKISENDSKNNLTNYIKDISSEKSKRRKRIYNFEETIQKSVSRKKTTPILKNIWGHGTINNCKKCSIFNDHVKKCRISNLFFGINRVADKKLLNMKCLECFRFKIHLGSKQCPDCQNWILIKNFDRHIDECRNSTLVKDICFKCNRECYLKLICNDGIWHKHRCYRQLKLFKTSRFSAKRKKILRNMEKNGLRNKKSKKKKVTNKLKTK